MKFLHSFYLNILFCIWVIVYFFFLWKDNMFIFENISEVNNIFTHSNIYIIAMSLLIIFLDSITWLLTSFFTFNKWKSHQKHSININKFWMIITGLFMIFYGIIIVWKIFSWYIPLDFIWDLFFLLLFSLLFFKNRYIFKKLKNPEYLQNITVKNTSVILVIYLVLFTTIWWVYSRDLDIYDIPENYFKEYEVDIFAQQTELIKNLEVSNQLSNLSRDYLSNIENNQWNLEILKNNPELIIELENILKINTNTDFENSWNYDSYIYSNYVSLVRLQSLYASYQLSLGNNQKAVAVLKNTIENNQKLFKKSPSLINTLVYITTQKIVFTAIENNNALLSNENIKNIMSNINNISSQEIFKNALTHEMIVSQKHSEFIPSLPLIFSMSEMNDIHTYYTYLSIENKGESIEQFIIEPKLTRKNYFGIFMIKNSMPLYTSQYKKLQLLEENIKKYKNL